MRPSGPNAATARSSPSTGSSRAASVASGPASASDPVGAAGAVRRRGRQLRARPRRLVDPGDDQLRRARLRAGSLDQPGRGDRVDAIRAVDLGDIPGDPVRGPGPGRFVGVERSGRRDLHDGALPAGQRARPATGTAAPTTTPPGMSARSTATPPTTSPRRAARRPSTSAPSSPAPPAWRTRPAPLSRH